jgi:hypothetical protein
MLVPLKKKITLILLNILLLVVSLVMIGKTLSHQLGCDGQLMNNLITLTPDQQIMGDRMVGQSFIAPRNQLNRIDIFFLTYQRRNTPDVSLRLLEITPELTNPLHGVEVYQTTFKASTLQDQGWRTFTFSPLAISLGRTYLIVLQSPTATDGNAITVGGIQQDVYPQGSAFLGPTPLQADIAFRSCYQMTLNEKVQTLAQRLTENRPGPWQYFNFYLLMLASYLLLLSALLWQLVKLIP